MFLFNFFAYLIELLEGRHVSAKDKLLPYVSSPNTDISVIPINGRYVTFYHSIYHGTFYDSMRLWLYRIRSILVHR